MNTAQFFTNTIVSLNLIYLGWENREFRKTLSEIFDEIEAELSEKQRKIQELEKQLEQLKTAAAK